ncbi:MAG TPA: HK97 family phage prohead protease [Thermoanaerobaculaceae bacterium]|nr:HK97 family phage prohead protease [Thermoanaerobaculaceae bacterium]HPS78531.1 HK97 family phage prohead protease [Thermoanaerobaculaceae bacterium]
MENERRVVLGDLHVERRGAGGSPGRLEGHAVTFNQETTIDGMFREIVRPGAFRRALRDGQDVVACIEHEGGLAIVGRTTAGTLQLSEDERGLAFANDLPSTQVARDLAELVGRREISQMSFRFRVVSGGDRWTEGFGSGMLPLRELIDVDLFDVSYVGRGAYPTTDVALRSARVVLAEYRARRGGAGDLDLARRRMAVDEAELTARLGCNPAGALQRDRDHARLLALVNTTESQALSGRTGRRQA